MHCIQLKGNLVYTASRAARGRPDASPLCNACTATETLAHILQRCERTSDARIARHDSVSKYLISALHKKGFTTKEELAISTPAGTRYPDIVAWDEHKCVVIDMTIVADNFPTNDAHERKRIYYDKPAIREWCGQRSGRPPEEIHFTACAINWRGTPATRSTTELLDLCGISRNDFLLMSVRTLEQGVKINATFHRSTTNYGNRRWRGGRH